jgi:hypothetical protein
MNADLNPRVAALTNAPIDYASRLTRRRSRRWRLLAMLAAFALYVGSYFVVRAFVAPAANMAYFIYPRAEVLDGWCYYGYWPLYQVDRALTGRTHNRDRKG